MTSNYVYETKQKGQIILLEHGMKKHCLDWLIGNNLPQMNTQQII